MFGPLLFLAIVSALLQAPQVETAGGDLNAVHDDDLLASTLQRLQRLEQQFGEEKQQWLRQKEQWEAEKQQWLQEKLQREGEEREWQSFKQDMLDVFQSLEDKMNSPESASRLTKRVPENVEISRETRKPHKDDWEKPLRELQEEVNEIAERLGNIQGNTTVDAKSVISRMDAQEEEIGGLKNNQSLIMQAIDVINVMLQGMSGKVNTLDKASTTMVTEMVEISNKINSNAAAASIATARTQALDTKMTIAMQVQSITSTIAIRGLNQKVDRTVQAFRRKMEAGGEEMTGTVQTLAAETEALNKTIKENVQTIHNDMGFMVRGLFRMNDDVEKLSNETNAALKDLENKMDSQSQTLDGHGDGRDIE